MSRELLRSELHENRYPVRIDCSVEISLLQSAPSFIPDRHQLTCGAAGSVDSQAAYSTVAHGGRESGPPDLSRFWRGRSGLQRRAPEHLSRSQRRLVLHPEAVPLTFMGDRSQAGSGRMGLVPLLEVRKHKEPEGRTRKPAVMSDTTPAQHPKISAPRVPAGRPAATCCNNPCPTSPCTIPARCRACHGCPSCSVSCAYGEIDAFSRSRQRSASSAQNDAYSSSRAGSSPKQYSVVEPARQAYSHCASVGKLK